MLIACAARTDNITTALFFAVACIVIGWFRDWFNLVPLNRRDSSVAIWSLGLYHCVRGFELFGGWKTSILEYMAWQGMYNGWLAVFHTEIFQNFPVFDIGEKPLFFSDRVADSGLDIASDLWIILPAFSPLLTRCVGLVEVLLNAVAYSFLRRKNNAWHIARNIGLLTLLSRSLKIKKERDKARRWQESLKNSDLGRSILKKSGLGHSFSEHMEQT